MNEISNNLKTFSNDELITGYKGLDELVETGIIESAVIEQWIEHYNEIKRRGLSVKL